MGRRVEGPVASLATEIVLSGEKIPGRKFGVVIVGGAMAGVGPGGMAEELGRNGVTRVAADGLYGDSGGGIAAAYTASRQESRGITIYYEHANTRNFIDLSRLPRSLLSPFARPAVDLNFLINDVMVHRTPLDTEEVRKSAIPVQCSATDAITGERVIYDLSKEPSGKEIRHILRAGATLPVLAGVPVPHKRRLLYDGGVKDSPIAIQLAIQDGCTDILVLHNGMVPSPKDKLTQRGARVLRKDFPRTAELLDIWPDVFKRTLDWIHERAANPVENPTPETPNIEILVPGIEVGMLEKRRQKLVDAAQAGRRVVREHFPRLTEVVYKRQFGPAFS